MTEHSLDIGPDAFPRDSWNYDAADALMNAIDLASDQDQRTWITENGKPIAMIVTVEDGERLARLDNPLIPHDSSDDASYQAWRDAQLAEPPDTLRELREPS